LVEKRTDTPVFDREFLFRSLDGDASFAACILEVFTEDCRRMIAELKKALETGNTAEVRRFAHSLKGAAGNVGASRLRAAAREAEEAASGGNAEEVLPFMEIIEKEFEAFRLEVEKWGIRQSGG